MITIDGKIMFLLFCLYLVGIIVIGYVIYKAKDGQYSTLKLLIDLLKFIVKCEYIPPEGKTNSMMGIMVIIAALILSLPLTFAFAYKAFFGKDIISINVFNYIFMYFMGCSLFVGIVRALLSLKLPVANKEFNAKK